MFFQVKEIEAAPDYFGLPFEDVYLETSDKLKINAWFIPSPAGRFTLLFLHGNGGNISHRLHKIAQLHSLGVNIFLVDYRGYGRSQGVPSVKGVYQDAQAAFNFLTTEKKIRPGSVVLYGESLGSAPAVRLASENKAGGLILDGGFSCGRDMAKIFFPYIPSCFMPDAFNNLKYISQVKVPKLFIHSKADEIVPVKLARKLYSKAGEPKEFVWLLGGHNTSYIDSLDKYLSSISSFINKIEKEKLC